MLLHESQRFMLDNAMNTVSSTLPPISLNLTLTLWQDYAAATLQCMKTWHLTGITSQIKGWWWQAPSEKPDTNCPTSLLISTFWKMSNLVQLQLQPTVMEDFFLPPTEVLNVNCFLSNKALFIVTMFNIKNVTGQDKHRKVSHHCPLFVGEVDSDGSSTSGWILWTGLPWGGVGGGGGGHGERQEGIGGGQGEGKTQYLDTKASGELHAQWGPEEFALYLEPTQTKRIWKSAHRYDKIDNAQTLTTCININR